MKWTAEDTAKLREARSAGMSYASIGVLLGRSEVSVWAKAEFLKIPSPRPL